MNLFLRNCTFSCKKNKKDYLNICHIKKKKFNTCDIPTIEFIVFMWKQCFRGTKQNSSELPVSSFDFEEFCFALFSFFLYLFCASGRGEAARVALRTGYPDGDPVGPEEPLPAQLR